MGPVTLNNEMNVHASSLGAIFVKNHMNGYSYIHEGPIDANEKLPDLQVEVIFSGEHKLDSTPIWNSVNANDSVKRSIGKIWAFIDTGASHTQISRFIVPDELLLKHEGNTRPAMGTSLFENIVIPKVTIKFPGQNLDFSDKTYELPEILAYDDTDVRIFKGSSRKHYPLIIGNDILKFTKLIYKGTEGKYTLKWVS